MALRPVALAAVVLSFALLSACAPGGASVDDFIAGNGSISIVTLAMSDGTTFLEYGDDITAQGGAGSYSWSLAGGALPPGLTLTGGTPTATISGTPSLAGTFDFTIRATDQTGRSATQDLTIDVSRPTLTVNDPLVDEGDSGAVTMTFTVTLSPAINLEVEVDYTTADITASSVDLDYLDTSGSLTFSPGATSRSFDVLVVGDTDYENGVDETFKVILSGAVNADIGGFGIGTIANDDLVGASIADATLTEGDGGNSTMRFTVSLDNPASQVVRIDYTTTAGTATAGADYTTVSNQVQFTPNTSTQQINYIDVLITGDVIAEISETFTVTLSNPSGCTLIDDTATGTITDNGDDAQIDIDASQSALEGAIAESTPMVFTVTLSNVQTLASDITVDYDVIDGTATEAGAGGPADGTNDYDVAAGVSGTLTFTASPLVTTQTITITVNGDDFGEGHEDFTVDLSGLTGNGGNAVLGVASGTGTISSDDPPSISIDDWSTFEGKTGATTKQFTVSLTHYIDPANPLEDYSVDFQVTDGTATVADNDYSAPGGAMGTLDFDDGVTLSLTIDIDVNGDGGFEMGIDETMSVVLSNPTGGALIADTAGTGTIQNDDGQAPVDRFTFDFNGDGLGDIVMGAPGVDVAGGIADQGKVYVFLGRTGGFPAGPITYSAAVADIIIVGENAGGAAPGFGTRACGIKDMDGDGIDEIAVGVNVFDKDATDTDVGAVYLFFGARSGIDLGDNTLPSPGAGEISGPVTILAGVDDYPHIRFLGNAKDDKLGISVGNAFDFNGDGYNDLITGATQFVNPGTIRGKAYIVLGSGADYATGPYPLLLGIETNADVIISGGAAGASNNDNFGKMAVGVGDVNDDPNDGTDEPYDDILIGANQNDTTASNAGKAYLILGRAIPTPPISLDATTNDARFTITANPMGSAQAANTGASAAYIGDINGDDIDDILVCAPREDENAAQDFWGTANIYYGTTAWNFGGATTSDALPGDVRIRHTVGSALGDKAELGWSCTGLGDFDGGGVNDFAVGAYLFNAGGTDRGEALIFRGEDIAMWPNPATEANAFIRFQGTVNGDLSGRSIASVGDLNNDGRPDLIAGAEQAAAQNGKCVVIYSGTAGGTIADSAANLKFTGEAAADKLSSVSSGH